MAIWLRWEKATNGQPSMQKVTEVYGQRKRRRRDSPQPEIQCSHSWATKSSICTITQSDGSRGGLLLRQAEESQPCLSLPRMIGWMRRALATSFPFPASYKSCRRSAHKQTRPVDNPWGKSRCYWNRSFFYKVCFWGLVIMNQCIIYFFFTIMK